MKKYNEDSTCIKCGYSLADVEYKGGVFIRGINEGIQRIGDDNDYLLRTCRRCGYYWPEAVISKEHSND